MKTKNNVQKAILRLVAVIVSFVLISFTVTAQDFWKKLIANSSFNEIALAMVETSREIVGLESTTENFKLIEVENEVEPALELEEWMSDERNFGVSDFQIIDETKDDLDIETWRLD